MVRVLEEILAAVYQGRIFISLEVAMWRMFLEIFGPLI